MKSNLKSHYKVKIVFQLMYTIFKMPRDSLAYPSLIPSCKDLDKVYRQIRKLLNYDQYQKKGEGSANSERNIDDVNQRPKSSACIWTRIT